METFFFALTAVVLVAVSAFVVVALYCITLYDDKHTRPAGERRSGDNKRRLLAPRTFKWRGPTKGR